MLVFRFGKDIRNVDFCEKRVVFQQVPGVDAAPPVDATLAPPKAPAKPEAPVVAAREAGAAAVENKGDKAKETLKADIDLEKLKATLGADFEKLLTVFGTEGFSGTIKVGDVNPATLDFGSKLKEDLGGKIAVALTAVDWGELQKVFDAHYKTGADFQNIFINLITAVSVGDLQTKVKALKLDQFEPFKSGKASIEYNVSGFGAATTTVNDTTGKYAEFEKAQQAAQGEVETKEQREAGKKEMIAAIKANGGWVGSLFLAFQNSKDPKTGKTLIDRLYDGEVPALSVVFGARGVKYGKFEEMYANIKESAQDTKADGWIGKFEKAVGKGKAAALQETLALFQNTAGLSMESFKAYFDGTKALEDMYSLKDGYTAEAGKILKITLPKGTKMLVPPNTDYTVAIGSTAALAEKKAGEKPVEIEAVATRTLEVSAKALPPTTILPKGATVKEIA